MSTPRATDVRPFPAGLLVLTIFLVALNLRAALAALPPLVRTIQADLGIDGATAGLLTTLPVLCMGLFAPVAQRLAHRVGREATVGWALVLLLAGQLLRLGGAVLPVLLLSTLLVGIGIALAGTVLPGIVKEFFGDRSGLMTGVYLLAMMVGAAAASAFSVPISDAAGSWQVALAVWAAFAVVGLAAWLPVVRRVNDRADPDDGPGGTGTRTCPGAAPPPGCWPATSRCSRWASTPRSPGSPRPTSRTAGRRGTPACCCRCGASRSWSPGSPARRWPTGCATGVRWWQPRSALNIAGLVGSCWLRRRPRCSGSCCWPSARAAASRSAW